MVLFLNWAVPCFSQRFDVTAGPWPVYLRSGQLNRTKIGPLGQLIFSGHLGQQLSFLPTFSLFVISTNFFFNSLRNNPWWCFSLTGRCHVFHNEFRIDEIWRYSRAMNQRNGIQRFSQNNVIGCYTYQQGHVQFVLYLIKPALSLPDAKTIKGIV
jgi:hypothetical protein